MSVNTNPPSHRGGPGRPRRTGPARKTASRAGPRRRIAAKRAERARARGRVPGRAKLSRRRRPIPEILPPFGEGEAGIRSLRAALARHTCRSSRGLPGYRRAVPTPTLLQGVAIVRGAPHQPRSPGLALLRRSSHSAPGALTSSSPLVISWHLPSDDLEERRALPVERSFDALD